MMRRFVLHQLPLALGASAAGLALMLVAYFAYARLIRACWPRRTPLPASIVE